MSPSDPARGEIEADAADREHRRRLDVRLDRAFAEGIEHWDDLLLATEGADPRLVAAALRHGDRSVEGLGDAEAPSTSRWSPELHARDFEWYFTRDCARAMAARVAALGRRVLCLGTPTVAFALLDEPPLERLTLVDRNPLVQRRDPRLGAVQLLHEDLDAARLDGGPYDVAIFDAPWYPAALERWLTLAAHAVRPGGRVLFALLPRLHRPSALEDRARLLALARTMGTVQVEPGALHYETPRFEHEALAAAGLRIPATWRRADLVELCVPRPPRIDHLVPATAEPAWLRFLIGAQVVHLDPRAPDEPGEMMDPIDERGDYRYTSISTRDPSRARIGLWTSRSRVARVRRPSEVAALLERLADTGDLRALDDAPTLRTMSVSERARLLDALGTLLGSSVRPAATDPARAP